MSYNVVEFDDGGGGVSIIRRDWLTPQKRHCMWPPQKLMSKFIKCLDGSIAADNTWDKFKIKRVFYETDDLAKAKQKERQAEIDSEINSDDKSVRRRKKTRKIYDSSDDTSAENSDNAIVYPTAPSAKLGPVTVSKKSSKWRASPGKNKHQHKPVANSTPGKSEPPQKEVATKVCSTPGTSTDEEYICEKIQKQVAATKVRSTSPGTSTDEEYICEKIQKQVAATKVRSTPGTSTDEEYICEKIQKQVAATKVRSTPGTSTDEGIAAATEASLPSLLSSLDLTVTPFLKEPANSQALDVIAKHLAHIQTDVKELQISQQEILQRLRSSSSTPLEHSLPDGITMPCDDNEELINIETWINTTKENKKLLVTYLSLVGGNKIPVIIRRILEKLFTNKLAVQCNWTGKNKKIALKDLELIKIIRDAVRQNQIAANTTDAEIHEVISNWFRFTKDRNGGREARRVKQ